MIRFVLSILATFVATSLASAQPSYSKDIRPFLVKYCLECHNAKTLKGALSLETYKEAMDGSDGGPVIVPGKPNDSRLVLLIEHKDKPTMPPPKAKFQPTKGEIKLVRAWVMDGAKDDAASVKVELPAIKAKKEGLAPVTAVGYRGRLFAVRGGLVIFRNDGQPPDIFDVRVSAFRCSPVDDYVALGIGAPGETGKTILYWSGPPRPHISELPVKHTDAILDVAFAPSGKLIASAGYDALVQITNLQDPKETVTIKEHSDAVYGLAFSPDGKLLASVSADRAMKVFDVERGKLLYTLGHATDWLYCVAWSPDGKYLVSGGVDKSIRVYEPTATGAKLRQSVFAHEGPVLKVVFSSDSKTLYSVGQDRIVKAWDIEKMVERKVYAKQPETVLCLALREDAGQIIVGRYDGIVQLIDMKTGKVAHEFGNEKQQPKPRDKRSVSRGSINEPRPLGSGGGGPLPNGRGSFVKTATLDRAGAVHSYRFDVKQNQQVGAKVIADGKTKFEPVLTLTDATGRVLAESNDGHLGHTFAEAGACSISVRDRDFRGGADFKYRLEFGDIPIVTAVFPMGMQRGTKGDIQIDGVFLPKKVIAFEVPAKAKPGQMIPLPIGANVLGKAQIVVGEFPEVIGGTIPVPGTANGRIQKDNQKDLWSFAAKKGQPLIVEVNARRIGSRLDSVIEILDANDQPVPRAVLRSQAKTNVTFRDHDSAQGNIRIEAWSELGVNDYLFVGNELMKIKELPTHPDADCNFFAADGKRLGLLDTTPTHHANGTPMYKVSVHPPGTTFPPNGYPVFTLYYKNDDGGPGYGRDSRIFFDPPADGTYNVRIADARGMGGANFGYRLTVRPPNPHFTLKYSPQKPTISRGGAAPITISADRIDGYDGPITVQVKNLPPGLHMPKTTIEAGLFTTTAALYAHAKLPAKAPAAILEGLAFNTGMPLASLAPFELPILIEPGDLVTTTADSEVAIKPGSQAKMLVRIERRNGFKGRVPLDVKGLPHGVRVIDIGLNGILVNENETARTVVIYAEPWVQPMERPFVVLAKREGKGTEHAAKAVMLKVK